jgi:hypothetical protein
MRLLIHTLALAAFGLSVSAAQNGPASPPLSLRERLLLGTWRSPPAREYWIITRRADRTFTEDCSTDYPTPRSRFICTGIWRVVGNRYHSRYLSCSDPARRSFLHRENRAHIYSLTDAKFVFQYEDAELVSEQKRKRPR